MSMVGKQIDSHCLKCKLVLAHIVMYEVHGAVSKVKCKTCGAEHKYRGVKQPSGSRDVTGNREVQAKRPKPQNRQQMPVNPAPIQWETKRRNLDAEAPVKPYRIHDAYQEQDIIRHPVFGLGFVERIGSSTRMEVLFREGLKSMAMNVG